MNEDDGMRSRKEGWTLVETLGVLAVILLLTSATALGVRQLLLQAREVQLQSDFQILRMALERYRLDNQSYPTSDQGLEALWKTPFLAPLPNRWRGPYLEVPMNLDPWGLAWKYRTPGVSGRGFDLTTGGVEARSVWE